jgi:2-keto-4-pentenoate hydratase
MTLLVDNEMTNWAQFLLADRDALTPWRSFVPPDEMTPDEAYALQGEVARLREERGELVIGYKIGCTSQVIRDQLGMREAIFGRLFDTECWPSGTRLNRSRFANLAIEGELAIRLAEDLPSTPLSDEEYIRAVGSVFPVIELHQHALPENGNRAAALIACGGMHAGFVTGVPETTGAGRCRAVKALEVHIDDHLVGRTEEPWTMGGPASTLRWLTQRLAGVGLQLRGGQVVLTGSPLPLFPVNPRTRVVVLSGTGERQFCSVEID